MMQFSKFVAGASLAAALSFGCGGGSSGTVTKDLRMVPDLTVLPDMTLLAPIGGACSVNTDCGEGKSPVCWKKVANLANAYPTPGGYCSSRCVDDSECGDAGVCVNFGGTVGQWCLSSCEMESDCRPNGYACWTDGLCFISAIFDCDPAAGDGTCATAGPMNNLPGGCDRAALGSGMKGLCNELCEIGPGTCPADQSGNPYACLVSDARYSLSGMATGDKFVGPVCTNIPKTGAKPIGMECKYTDGRFYTNVCVDGAECYLKGASPAGMGFDAKGDNKCKQLCYLPGGPPMSKAPPCAMGTTCKDIFGLANHTNPTMRVGYCM